MFIDIVIFAVIGVLGAVVISFVGGGASLIILPTLISIFPSFLGTANGIKIAVGTTMASVLVTAINGAYRQRKFIQFDKTLFWPVSGAYIVGAFLGSFISHWVPATLLHYYIGGLLFLAAIKNIFFAKKIQKQAEPRLLIIIPVSLIISILCSMAAVASGLLFIPFISRYLSHRTAVATSIMCGVIYAIFGTLGYLLSGLGRTNMPAHTIGYIYWPALVIISIATFIAVPLFMRLAHNTNVKVIKKIFYIFLLIVSLYLIFLAA